MPANSSSVIYVFGATSAGTITSIEIDIAQGTGAAAGQADITWAIVYVPEGYNANAPQDYASSTTFYAPEENVLAAGIASSNDNLKVRTKMAKRMRSGDRIAVVMRNNDNVNPQTGQFLWQASYLE